MRQSNNTKPSMRTREALLGDARVPPGGLGGKGALFPPTIWWVPSPVPSSAATRFWRSVRKKRTPPRALGRIFEKKSRGEKPGSAFHLRAGAVIGLILNHLVRRIQGRQNTLCVWILEGGLRGDAVTWWNSLR